VEIAPNEAKKQQVGTAVSNKMCLTEMDMYTSLIQLQNVTNKPHY